MIGSIIDATVFFRHSRDEVAALEAAIIPMADHIVAICGKNQERPVKAILSGRYFRAGEAAGMRTILLRAAKHARAHLSDYFPLMRDEIIRDAETLEQATEAYWQEFLEQKKQVTPTK